MGRAPLIVYLLPEGGDELVGRLQNHPVSLQRRGVSHPQEQQICVRSDGQRPFQDRERIDVGFAGARISAPFRRQTMRCRIRWLGLSLASLMMGSRLPGFASHSLVIRRQHRQEPLLRDGWESLYSRRRVYGATFLALPSLHPGLSVSRASRRAIGSLLPWITSRWRPISGNGMRPRVSLADTGDWERRAT